jgi:hypothetical protein
MMNLADIAAELDALRAAKRQMLVGRRVTGSSNPSTGSVNFATCSLAEINREIARLELLECRLTGRSSGFAPVIPGFGPRA